MIFFPSVGAFLHPLVSSKRNFDQCVGHEHTKTCHGSSCDEVGGDKSKGLSKLKVVDMRPGVGGMWTNPHGIVISCLHRGVCLRCFKGQCRLLTKSVHDGLWDTGYVRMRIAFHSARKCRCFFNCRFYILVVAFHHITRNA